MPFEYALQRHARRHGPVGYREWTAFKPWLRDDFTFRCTYCLFRERWYPSGADAFSVDHVVPRNRAAERICDYMNLVYACVRCNSLKRDVLTVDPTNEPLGLHLRLREDMTLEGLTPEGNDLIDLLHLNCNAAIERRQIISDIAELHRIQPNDPRVANLFRRTFQYPEDLPDLSSLRPPGGNRTVGSEETSFYALKAAGQLASTY